MKLEKLTLSASFEDIFHVNICKIKEEEFLNIYKYKAGKSNSPDHLSHQSNGNRIVLDDN